jgi:hypothetical protein
VRYRYDRDGLLASIDPAVRIFGFGAAIEVPLAGTSWIPGRPG